MRRCASSSLENCHPGGHMYLHQEYLVFISTIQSLLHYRKAGHEKGIKLEYLQVRHRPRRLEPVHSMLAQDQSKKSPRFKSQLC